MARSTSPRASVDGKFFRLGERRFFVKGAAYGPLAPPPGGEPSGFASPQQTVLDFAQLRALGANLIRVYQAPPRWFLDLAAEHELQVLIGLGWNQHLCFLDSPAHRAAAIQAVRRAVGECAAHPAVFAFSIANEISPDIIRWSGARAAADFIDLLIQEAKRVDAQCLCTFTNYPPTEFLQPQGLDFLCFNVYLHHRRTFRNYLARLQMLADSKPLLLGEFGMDSLREGEAGKCAFLEWQIEELFRGGLAGAIVFGFTDDWWRGGQQVENWAMGLTTRQREPKDSFRTVERMFGLAPRFALPRYPKVSVVVASYNGQRTLKACLDSLCRLDYPDYEIILVDDGSTDDTPRIASFYPNVRCFRHERNLGLSVARNTGIAAAAGEIVAFTDSDCRADQDWLYYLVGDLIRSEFVGIGGPNLPPPEDSPMAAVVMASPGGPAHVMLTDRQAEHIPGCNMAFYKWALAQIGGFDPIFRRAGDDVDLCWRLQQADFKIGFSPSAFVWHYRRPAIRDYLSQQHGYGEAEALLVRKHPECFSSLGGSIWRGRIYPTSRFGLLLRPPIIYRGLFGSAGFQFLYASKPAVTLLLCTTLEYHVFLTLPLWVLSAIFPSLLPLALASLLVPVAVCAAAGAQAPLPKDKTRRWSRPLTAMLFFFQPIVRGWARYQYRLVSRPLPPAARPTFESIGLRDSGQNLGLVQYWAEEPLDRLAFVAGLLRRLERQGWPNRADIGWSDYDVEIYDTRWSKLQLTTVAEEHPGGKQLLRCRLRPRWSLKAKLRFWLLCGLELVLLGLTAAGRPWLWLLLLTLPLFAAFLRRQERNLQSLIVVLLDQMAGEWKLSKVRQAPAPEPKAPALALSRSRSPFARRPEEKLQPGAVSPRRPAGPDALTTP
jgi:glycosyltransferase involved in cell wall biosynthesis